VWVPDRVSANVRHFFKGNFRIAILVRGSPASFAIKLAILIVWFPIAKRKDRS
jgi:hypothetical protein